MDPMYNLRGNTLSPAHGSNMNQSNTQQGHPSLPQEQSFESTYSESSNFTDSSYTNDYTNNNQYLDSNFVDFNQSMNDPNTYQSNNTSQTYLQPQGIQSQEQIYGYGRVNQLSTDNLNLDTSGQQLGGGSTAFPNLDYPDQALDPSLLGYSSLQSQQTSLDPTNLSYDTMTTMQQQTATPPHLLQPDMVHASQSPSPHQTPSPRSQSQMYNQITRPRNVSESLDPSSAAFPHGYNNNEWDAGAAFRQHRRAPSDTLSEISTHSAQASPYLGNMDGFDVNSQHISPLIIPQQDQTLFNDSLSFNQFNISDQTNPHTNAISPGHSPHISPSISAPQQRLPEFSPNDNFGMQEMNNNFGGTANGYDMFPPLSTDMQTGLNPLSGEADTMSPPEINIDFAPPSRQPSFRNNLNLGDALSPPEIMGRKRAISDPYTRSSSPGAPVRGRRQSLQPSANGRYTSLSPTGVQLPPSRSPSPGANRSRSPSSGSREHLIELANRDKSPLGTGTGPNRQKHAANFQCHLCPKRFTRAYNLRSHLRTHTDERPFVCTVCGKAFARQHDRKRHEGLHSGEKKFVCRGTLKSQQQWGCGRKFARADALGRHFRSEAGRVCIKPLLDEEAAERQKNWLEEQAQQQIQSQQGFVAPGPTTQQPQLEPVMPAALLQMYPEFANFNWGSMDAGSGQGMDEDFGGRSSFDASSGGEWDHSDNDMGDLQTQQGLQQQQQQQFNGGGQQGWSNQDMLSDFEGR